LATPVIFVKLLKVNNRPIWSPCLQASGNEEDLTSLLELLVLRTAPSRDWIARTDILDSVTACLRESHKTRTIFRCAQFSKRGLKTVPTLGICFPHTREMNARWLGKTYHIDTGIIVPSLAT
jgi:hypothetical protein